jgi:hypothetical protein
MQADSVRRCAFAPLPVTMVMLWHHQNRRNQRLSFALDLAVEQRCAPMQACLGHRETWSLAFQLRMFVPFDVQLHLPASLCTSTIWT